MSNFRDLAALDRNRIRALFDLRSNSYARSGAGYEADPNPIWHDLRANGPVHPGTVHDLLGYPGDWAFHGVPSPGEHFSAFSFEACDAALRDGELFSSTPPATDDGIGVYSSMLTMGGAKHRRYRSLVQPSFVPSRMHWWIENWINETVQAIIEGLRNDGRADLNLDFCAGNSGTHHYWQLRLAG